MEIRLRKRVMNEEGSVNIVATQPSPLVIVNITFQLEIKIICWNDAKSLFNWYVFLDYLTFLIKAGLIDASGKIIYQF